MDILSESYVIENGIEFTGDVCYSGEYDQQVYTTDTENGGVPINGILYEKYKNGKLQYYSYYIDGIANGTEVWFYESGKIKSICSMNGGTIDGEYVEYFEDGSIKLKKNCKYGLVITMHRYDENGHIIEEKNGLTESQKKLYDKWDSIYSK